MQMVEDKEITVSESYHNLFENYQNLFTVDRDLLSVTQCKLKDYSPLSHSRGAGSHQGRR